MQIRELYNLTNWIENNIKKNAVQQKYKQLHAVIHQNVNARNNQPKQPFSDQKTDLINSIKDINTYELSYEQERMLEKLNIIEFVGENGLSEIENILYRNNLDIASAANELVEIMRRLNAGIAQSDQIRASLANIIDQDEKEETEDIDVLMRVHFQNEVAMSNVTDFKKWGATWYDIGRGISMAHGSTPEDVKIVGAQKGSVIIELAVVAGIAATTSEIILSALKVVDRVLTIRKKAEEIKALKLSNKKLETQIEEEAQKEKSEGLSKITSDVSITLNINNDNQGDKVKALEKSVKCLIDFVENGGEVDFQVNENVDEAKKEQLVQLTQNFTEIKKIEQRVLALEHKTT